MCFKTPIEKAQVYRENKGQMFVLTMTFYSGVMK